VTIQHKDIPDANLHEPKGVSAAVANTVYTANGAGSGTWAKVSSQAIQGLSGDGGNSNKRLISDGANGFVFKIDRAYGTMSITNNTNGFALAAAADSTLNTNTDYVLYTGTGAPWASENLFGGVSFNTNRLQVPATGVYELDLWCNIIGFPTVSSSVGVKYRVNGTTFGPRKIKCKSNAAGDAGNLVGFGLITLNANDYIQLYFASTGAGNLTIGDLNATIQLIREL
jgi:hypothetical protein